MPHFVIDCSDQVVSIKTPQEIIQKVYDTADASGLFAPGEIKVRINPFQHYIVGGTQKDFIHVFGNIMEGRTVDQKKKLSDSIIRELKAMFPEVPVVSINIRDFEKATYSNRNLV